MSELKTCFKRVDYDLAGLLHYLISAISAYQTSNDRSCGRMRRCATFLTPCTEVSCRILPILENAQANGAKQIGVGGKQHAVPSRLIVDGQQRLTSLYAVFRGKKVLDDDYRERLIEIAFRPRDGRFEVADAATRRDPEWIPNISDLWASGKSSYQMVKGFLSSLREKAELSEEEEEQISHNLDDYSIYKNIRLQP